MSQIQSDNASSLQLESLIVVYNRTAVLEYDRKTPLSTAQTDYIDALEKRLQLGFQLGNDYIEQPNPMQIAQFVANMLIAAYNNEEDDIASACCSFLAIRIPDLQQLDVINNTEQGLNIEFIFDRSYIQTQQEQSVQFYKH